MSFFSALPATQIAAINFGQRAFFIIDGGRTSEMIGLLKEHEVQPHQYLAALDELVTGCALGDIRLPETKVAKMRESLSQFAASDPNRVNGIKVLAKSLVRDLKAQGYDNRNLLALAAELIGLTTKEITKERK